MVKLIYFVTVAIPIFAVDQITKHIIDSTLTLYSRIEVIPGFFNIIKAYNTGAAFSLFANRTSPISSLIFHLTTAVAVLIVIYLLFTTENDKKMKLIGLNMIIGGAMGNLFDRIVHGHVVDFLDFYIGKYHWPAFNVADSSIVIGTALLILALIREEREEQ